MNGIRFFAMGTLIVLIVWMLKLAGDAWRNREKRG